MPLTTQSNLKQFLHYRGTSKITLVQILHIPPKSQLPTSIGIAMRYTNIYLLLLSAWKINLIFFPSLHPFHFSVHTHSLSMNHTFNFILFGVRQPNTHTHIYFENLWQALEIGVSQNHMHDSVDYAHMCVSWECECVRLCNVCMCTVQYVGSSGAGVW